MKGKFIIAFDTICEGHQSGNDENGNPPLHDSYDEAFKEMFIDAVCSIEGNEEHLEDEVARAKMISEMNSLIKEDNLDKMKAYFDENPDANYSEEFIVPADEFVKGYKTIFTGV
jgi:hypothetical protein